VVYNCAEQTPANDACLTAPTPISEAHVQVMVVTCEADGTPAVSSPAAGIVQPVEQFVVSVPASTDGVDQRNVNLAAQRYSGPRAYEA
jgi:hypothetical protein